MRGDVPEEIVVTAPGGGLDLDDATQLDAVELARGGTADLLGALSRNIAGVSLSEAQSNPWQPNLVYRGYVASALQGNAQGLAAYLDGGRFNQPFGDTVNFDLLPEAALASVTIKDASPVYGLNALGGAIVFATKTGRSSPGIEVSAVGGRYGRFESTAVAGWARDELSAYAAVQANRDDGWRRFSPSTLYNGFADLGWDGANGGVHLKLVAADTDLTGNGSAPVELLAADRRAVFTHPDNTRNRYIRASLHPRLDLSDTTHLEATLYVQQLKQRTLNGDAADVQECDGTKGVLCLQTAVGGVETPLIGNDGGAIADTLDGGSYGLLNRSRTRSRAAGALVQLVERRDFGAGENKLILGFSRDASRTRFASSSELGALTDTRSVEGLGTIVAQPDGSITPVDLVARTRYLGLFVSERLPVTRRLTAELGLRWNEARVTLDDQLGTVLDGRHRYRKLNYGIEFDYELSDALTVRAGHAQNNRAPTPAELACADEAAPCSLTNFFVGDPPLRQVVAHSWEAGASGKLDGTWTLRWLVSAYRSINRDDIQFIASAIRGRAYFQNIGRTRRQGLEVSVDMTRGGWTLHGGYGLTDATFRDPLTLTSAANPGADDDGRISVERGDRLPGIPRHRGVVSVDYVGGGFGAGFDVQAQSGQVFFGDEGNTQPRTTGFAVLNLRGSLAVARPLKLFAEVNNAFDKRRATFGTLIQTSEIELSEAPGASDPRSIGPGAPRRWLIGVGAKF